MLPQLLATFLLIYAVIAVFPVQNMTSPQLIVMCVLSYLSYRALKVWRKA